MQHAFDYGLNVPHLGIANGMGKFTDEQVREIRLIASSGNASGRQLARYYKVTPTLISRMLLKQTYKHVQ